jgi:transcription antitermination factor NusG
MTSTPTTWCILRTAGARTLPLTQSLNAAGIQAWTPTAMVKRRKHRSPGHVEVQAPMLPTFVFVHADHLPELKRMARSPINPHPAFSVFRFDGRVPEIADREIEALRIVERRAVPRRRRPTLQVGTLIRPDEGAYAGLEGVVQQSDGRFTLVAFGGWMEVQIETLRLIGDEVGTAQPVMGVAA